MIKMICDICKTEGRIWHCGWLLQSRPPEQVTPDQAHIDGHSVDLCEVCKRNVMYVQDAIVDELRRRSLQ